MNPIKSQLMFSIVRSGGQFYFRIIARSNGKVLAHSERYKRKQTALRAIRSIVKHVQAASYWIEETAL